MICKVAGHRSPADDSVFSALFVLRFCSADLVANLLPGSGLHLSSPFRPSCSPKGRLMPKQPFDSPPDARFVAMNF